MRQTSTSDCPRRLYGVGLVKNRENGQQDMPPSMQDKPRRSPAPPLIAKAALATILLIGAMATTGYALSGGIGQHGDEVTPSEQQARLDAFTALGSLRLSAVSAEDIDHAVQGMQLTSSSAAALKADLASTSPESAPSALARASTTTLRSADATTPPPFSRDASEFVLSGSLFGTRTSRMATSFASTARDIPEPSNSPQKGTPLLSRWRPTA